eukprot:TRINITY_DN1434_c0_g1_i1.p1 TRINITY_DN1434_c0_g1~~TRINITY_DN1434_c0_g1_i1.p1  ORF type:complete len:428 (+),score=47.10 TRINITY_DN1434_c0_g1_i1:30-1286(+)
MAHSGWMLLLPVLVLLGLEALAHAAPLAANFSTCVPIPSTYPAHYNCCTLSALINQPPVIKDYQTYLKQTRFSNDRIRVRQAAHLVNETYAEKFSRAYELMKALPDDDPRSWMQQSNLHCLYGQPFIRHQQNCDQDYGIHKNWLLLPFHRWFLFFYERILATLIDDVDFALPYWNWDNQSPVEPLANVVPAMFNDPVKYPGLYDKKRQLSNTEGPKIINLSYKTDFHMDSVSEDEMRDINNAFLHQVFVEASRHDRDLVFSYPQRRGEPVPVYGGYFEAGAHGSIHFWTGVDSKEDMGMAYAAARDPLFFGHHANVDRLWNVWRSLEGGRTNYDDPDWYDAEFVLYDEMGELVKVKASDSVDDIKMGFVYQDVGNTWANYDLNKNPKVRDLVLNTLKRQPNQPKDIREPTEAAKSAAA